MPSLSSAEFNRLPGVGQAGNDVFTTVGGGRYQIKRGATAADDTYEELQAPNLSNFGIRLPDQPNLPNQAGAAEIPGLTTSRPAVNREDVRAQLEKEMQPSRDNLARSYDRRINDTRGIGVDQQRTLEGQLGTRRRFSSSAQAFIQFIDEKNKKAIADLEMQRDTALANFDLEMVQMIDKRMASEREAQQQELENAIKLYDLAQKRQADQLKGREKSIQASREMAITDLFEQGVREPAEIQNYLNTDQAGKQVGDITLEEISKTLEKVTADQSERDKLVMKLGESNAPREVIEAVGSAKTLVDAVTAAGDYLTPMTGIVGEYTYYKRQAQDRGETPISFQEYQDIDANRKRQVVNLNQSGMSTNQSNQFLGITNNFQKDPIILAADKSKTALVVADQVLANPNSASNQLKALYVLVKNLDPDSAVREGELSLASATQSYMDRFKVSLDRLSRGVVISPAAATELANATKELAKAWTESAAKRTNRYTSQANNADPVVGAAFSKYLNDFADMDSTDDVIQQTEESAKNNITGFVSKKPDYVDRVRALEHMTNPATGQAYSFQEMWQIIQSW